MTRRSLRIAVGVITLSGLSACGGSGGDKTTAPPTSGLTTMQQQVRSFGSTFETAFYVDVNGAPLDAKDSDLTPSLTTEPLDVN